MPEQQAFGKVLGKGRTVHDDEGTVLAAAVFVDGSRENLLACPGFPAEQNADIAVGTLDHGFQATADGRADPTSLFRFKGVVRWPEEESWAPQRF